MPLPRRTITWLVGLALLALSAPPTLAQVLPAPTGASWEALAAPQPAADPVLPGEIERFRVAFDAAPLAEGTLQRGDEMRVELPTGPRSFAVSRVDEHLPGTRSVGAVAADGSGELAALTYTAAGVVGLLSDGDDLYHVLPGGDGRAVLVLVDPAALDHLACGNGEHVHAPPAAPGKAGQAALGHLGTSPSLLSMADGTDDPITIDLLLLYTVAAEAWATTSQFGSIDAVIAQSLNLTNTALDNSATFLTVRLVHARQVSYDESIAPPEGQEGGASVWHLYRLTASQNYNPWGAPAAGFLLEAHALRNEYGADLVTLYAEVSDVGGIAFLLNTIGGRPELGFSVNRVQQMATSYTLAHEIGHNMGNGHGRDQPTNAAGPVGGIFPYSAGWRWTDEEGAGYNTVMSYGQQGDVRVPHFSNPAVTYLGLPTGSLTGPFAPADAARTLRETKRTVASYRQTQVAPPVAQADASLSVELYEGGEVVEAFSLSNTGLTDLVWEADLIPVLQARPALAPEEDGEVLAVSAKPADEEAPPVAGNLSPADLDAAGGDLLIIYATQFEASEGFAAGTHTHEGGWVTSQSAAPFAISTENPSLGTQHLRVPAVLPASSTINLYTPYFGPWPTGAYEFSVDLSISATGGSTYFVILRDGQTGQTAAGLALSSGGAILAFNPNEGNFTAVGHTWVPGQYRRYTVVVDPETRQVRYALDGQEVAARRMVGTGFGQLWIQRSNTTASDVLDVDNLVYQSLYRGLSWVRTDRVAGVVPPGQQGEVSFTFRSYDVPPGAYRATAVVRTNDPERPWLNVPIALTVLAGSSTEEDVLAGRTRLLGSHPNPTGGAARIGYVLARPAHVTLEVFSVTGQRVAVLADAYQPDGTYDVTLDTSGLAGGVYVYRLRAGDTVEAGRLTVLR